jgi:hypothetical protein
MRLVREALVDVQRRDEDPEVRLLIAAILRDDEDALKAVRSGGGCATTRLLRILRGPLPASSQ